MNPRQLQKIKKIACALCCVLSVGAHGSTLLYDAKTRTPPVAVTAQTASSPRAESVSEHNAVVTDGCSGRFGDQLLNLAHALYFSMKNNCEFFYIPFRYSGELVLSTAIKPYANELIKKFAQHLRFDGNDRRACLESPVSSALITIPYFVESLTSPLFYTDWENPSFKYLLRALMAPKQPLSLLCPPKDRISVAVHVRKGGSFESWPLSSKHGYHFYKIPQNDFYIDQIKQLFDLLGHQPLYVYLFTDDENPEELANFFKTAINIPSISYDYRRENNRHDANVLEDFFSMMHFDVLIRGDSNYSIMAEKLGDHSIVISTGDYKAGLQVQSGAIKIIKPFNDLRTKYASNAP